MLNDQEIILHKCDLINSTNSRKQELVDVFKNFNTHSIKSIDIVLILLLV